MKNLRKIIALIVILFPGMGHWVNGTGHPCQIAIIKTFLGNPTQEPDARCIQDMPNWTFYIPQEAGTGLSDVLESLVRSAIRHQKDM